MSTEIPKETGHGRLDKGLLFAALVWELAPAAGYALILTLAHQPFDTNMARNLLFISTFTNFPVAAFALRN